MLEIIKSDENVDITKVQNAIEKTIQKYGIQSEVEEHGKDQGKKYRIAVRDVEYEAHVSSKWIGFDLTVTDPTTGKKIGMSLDTDNYTLDGEYAQITQELFDELFACLRGY